MKATDDTTRLTATPERFDMRAARALVKAMIHSIAPNLDGQEIDHFQSLHDVADFDSLDFIHLVSLAAEQTGISIPPRDYPHVITVEGFANYLFTHQPS